MGCAGRPCLGAPCKGVMNTRNWTMFVLGTSILGVLTYFDEFAEGTVTAELEAEIVSAARASQKIYHPAVAKLKSGERLGVKCDASSVGDKVVLKKQRTNILRRLSYRCDYYEFR